MATNFGRHWKRFGPPWTESLRLKETFDRDTLEFATGVTERVGAFRRGSDPLAFTTAMLDKVNAALRVLVDAIQPWQEETTDYKPVDAAVDGVIGALCDWPSLKPDQEAANTSAALSKMSEATEDTLSSLGKRRDALSESLDALTATQKELKQAADQLEAANSQAIAELEKSWKSAQRHRDDEAYAAVKDLRGLRGEAQAMVHESTALMVGTDYANQANARRKSARWYDIGAVVFGVLGLLTLFLYLGDVGTDTLSFGLAVARLGLTGGALVIGGFLASRGRVQHREARELQRTALALSRMAPFVANLDPVAREVLTIETADRIFTRGELGSVTDRPSVLDKLQALRQRQAQEGQEELGETAQ